MIKLSDQLLEAKVAEARIKWPLEPCGACGQEHRQRWGKPSCVRHRSAREPVTGVLVPCIAAPCIGVDICRKHGAGTPKSRAKRAREKERLADVESERRAMIAIQRSARLFGVPREIDPREGIIEAYFRSAGVVTAFERRIAGMTEQELTFGIVSERVELTAVPGIVGLDGEGPETREYETKTVTTSAPKPHIMLKLFNEERDRFEKLGLAIVGLGLEARRDEYIAAQVDVLMGVLGPAALTDEQRRVIADGLRRLGHPQRELDAVPEGSP